MGSRGLLVVLRVDDFTLLLSFPALDRSEHSVTEEEVSIDVVIGGVNSSEDFLSATILLSLVHSTFSLELLVLLGVSLFLATSLFLEV